MVKTKIALAATSIIIIAIALTVTTTALLADQQTIPSQGNIQSTAGIAVYTNPAATTPCTNIDWGTLDEGTTATHTVYVKNIGDTTETLHLTTTDWTPTASASLMTLSWDKEDTTINPDSVVAATLTLAAAEDMADVDSFNFNIIIQGTA